MHRQQEGSGPRVAGLRAQWHVSLGWSTTSSDLAAGQTAPACGFPASLCSGLRFRAGVPALLLGPVRPFCSGACSVAVATVPGQRP